MIQIPRIVSLDMILHNRDWHISYTVRLLVVVAGQRWRKTCTFLHQPGGVGSSRQAPTRSTGTADESKDDKDNEDVDQRQEELGLSQLQDAPRLSLCSSWGPGDDGHQTLTL
jgi:hypothetical protein